MKKIVASLLLVLLLVSCADGFTFTKREDGAIVRSDEKVFYPIDYSYRYQALGIGKKAGEILGAEIYFVKDSDDVISVDGECFVSEDYADIDAVFENCTEFLFLEKSKKINQRNINKADKLTGGEAEDFSFYVFYGQTPEALGYKTKEYIGEIIGVFDTDLPLVSSYPAYKLGERAYAVEIDGEVYTLDYEWSKKIGFFD